MASMMCKALWRWIVNRRIDLLNYANAAVCRCFKLDYTPMGHVLPRVTPAPAPPQERIVITIDPDHTVYRQIRAWRIQYNGGTFTESDWRSLLARDKKCLRCGTTKRLSRDHIVPVAKGGQHIYDNMQVLCRSCNSWKGTKTVDFRRN